LCAFSSIPVRKIGSASTVESFISVLTPNVGELYPKCWYRRGSRRHGWNDFRFIFRAKSVTTRSYRSAPTRVSFCASVTGKRSISRNRRGSWQLVFVLFFDEVWRQLQATAPPLRAVKCSVQRRQNQQRERGGGDDSADDDRRERALDFGAASVRKRHRQKAERGDKRRHQDGAQPGN